MNVGIPPAFEAILTRALEKDRRLRYERAGDLRNDLQRLMRDGDSPAALVGSTQKREEPPSHGSRRLVSALVLAATVIFATATVGWLWLRSSRERWALEQAPEIARLVEAEEFGKAAALIGEARAILPKIRRSQRSGRVRRKTPPSRLRRWRQRCRFVPIVEIRVSGKHSDRHRSRRFACPKTITCGALPSLGSSQSLS